MPGQTINLAEAGTWVGDVKYSENARNGDITRSYCFLYRASKGVYLLGTQILELILINVKYSRSV
jgi:hypothetical protein